MDEQALAGDQAGLGEDGVVGGGEDLGGAAGLAATTSGSGTATSTRSWTTRQLGLTAAADDPHHAVALVEALGTGTAAPATSPASSSPGMSWGDPGGAG